MERAADDTFLLAMRYLEDAMMIRRSAAHFSDSDFRQGREIDADSMREQAYELVAAQVGVKFPAGQP